MEPVHSSSVLEPTANPLLDAEQSKDLKPLALNHPHTTSSSTEQLSSPQSQQVPPSESSKPKTARTELVVPIRNNWVNLRVREHEAQVLAIIRKYVKGGIIAKKSQTQVVRELSELLKLPQLDWNAPHELGELEFIECLETHALQPVTSSAVNPAPQVSPMLLRPQEVLRWIFDFYAKSTTTFGTKPTFEEILSNNRHWNLSKFMVFCKDYAILSADQVLSIDTLTSVFKKHSMNGQTMNCNQFLFAFSTLASSFFNEKYDKLHGTTLCHCTDEQKLDLFLEFIQKHRPVRVSGLPAKAKAMPRATKAKLEAWRKERKQSPEVGVSPFQRSPAKTHRRVTSERVNYSLIHNRRKLSGPQPSSVQALNTPLTFQVLDTLSFPMQSFKDQEMSDDPLFQELYGDKSALLRLHDSRLAKGLKVLHKFNP